jgi:hypothetical protein
MSTALSLVDFLGDEVQRLRLLVAALETENELLRAPSPKFDFSAERPALLRPQI